VICVDSSVWIGRLRNQTTAQVSLLEHFIRTRDDEILVGDLILLTLLQGAGDDRHAARLERALRMYRPASMMNDTLAALAASHYRLLRDKGCTIRKTIDLIIGTFCIAHDHILLHDDRDFDPMVTHLGLRVLTF
jgi:predicted nucleic acid-binding protein